MRTYFCANPKDREEILPLGITRIFRLQVQHEQVPVDGLDLFASLSKRTGCLYGVVGMFDLLLHGHLRSHARARLGERQAVAVHNPG
jgi:hypothetical protein